MSSETQTDLSGADKAKYVKAMLEGIPGAARSDKPQVEVLRKIAAPPTTSAISSNPQSAMALELVRLIEVGLQDGDLQVLTPAALQALIGALCKLYGAQVEASCEPPILQDRNAVPVTEVMQVCGALLEAVGLQVFELGMWQSWSGRSSR